MVWWTGFAPWEFEFHLRGRSTGRGGDRRERLECREDVSVVQDEEHEHEPRPAPGYASGLRVPGLRFRASVSREHLLLYHESRRCSNSRLESDKEEREEDDLSKWRPRA